MVFTFSLGFQDSGCNTRGEGFFVGNMTLMIGTAKSEQTYWLSYIEVAEHILMIDVRVVGFTTIFSVRLLRWPFLFSDFKIFFPSLGRHTILPSLSHLHWTAVIVVLYIKAGRTKSNALQFHFLQVRCAAGRPLLTHLSQVIREYELGSTQNLPLQCHIWAIHVGLVGAIFVQ
ncbi:unnamed protein product [Lactuca saligna]|uniref:Uncharacterized protein n=1 Tax=Lactuca saligna TaxID=75948 RepID=A0AA36A4U3_LACSI|nr:unnamed protein product [Lactuca saligna]